MTIRMKQRYRRTYRKGRPTNGWERGERVTDVAQVKPGDVLIVVSPAFAAENLIRLVPRESDIGSGFNYVYADYRTLAVSDGWTMFCHDFQLRLGRGHDRYYRAIDRRPPAVRRTFPVARYRKGSKP